MNNDKPQNHQSPHYGSPMGLEEQDNPNRIGGPGPGGNRTKDLPPKKMDEVTGLIWVSWFFATAHLQPEKYPLDKAILVFFNVMNFKAINQRFGFEGGNDYLRVFAEETKKLFKEETVARAGADHLTIISFNLDLDTIISRLEKLSKIMKSYEKGLRSHIKAGIYIADGTEKNPVVMMDHASIACNEVRTIFNKHFAIYDEELRKKHELKQYVLDHFEEAFEKNYFQVYYQPVVRALTGKVCGYEALARWNDPKRGQISPLVFIEVLEKVHLIHRLDALIIDQVCADLRDDIDSGFPYQPISVNLSRLDFELSDIKKVVDTAIAKYNVPKEYLVLEVTESAFSSDLSNLGDTIRSFREEGYQVWLDDFGSGYSSFNNLQSYDFDFLKIDMFFLRTFDTNPRSRIIIASIINLAKTLNIHTLAEGVETKEQFEFLKNIGCELIQGYYFGKPSPKQYYVDNQATILIEEKNELRELREYYDEIGRLNFLDSSPLDALSKIEMEIKVPIAIVEFQHDSYHTLYANDVYMEFLKSIGAQTVDDSIRLFFTETTSNSRHGLRRIMEKSEQEKCIEDFNTVINSFKVNGNIRFIGRTGDRTAFAFTAKNLTYIESK